MMNSNVCIKLMIISIKTDYSCLFPKIVIFMLDMVGEREEDVKVASVFKEMFTPAVCY